MGNSISHEPCVNDYTKSKITQRMKTPGGSFKLFTELGMPMNKIHTVLDVRDWAEKNLPDTKKIAEYNRYLDIRKRAWRDTRKLQQLMGLEISTTLSYPTRTSKFFKYVINKRTSGEIFVSCPICSSWSLFAFQIRNTGHDSVCHPKGRRLQHMRTCDNWSVFDISTEEETKAALRRVPGMYEDVVDSITQFTH